MDTMNETDAIESTALEVRRPAASNAVLMPMDAQQVVQGMRAYQQLLRDLLDPSDWQREDGNGRALKDPFPKKSAWRKIARAFNLSFELVRQDVTRDDTDRPLRAESVVRAIAPNGQYGDGDGYCTLSEFTGRRAGDPKLENTMRATATTRAKNRAIADLVGMGEVAAEDLAAGDNIGGPVPVEASDELKQTVRDILGFLFDGDAEAIDSCVQRLAEQFGGLPVQAGQAIAIVGVHVRHHKQTQPDIPVNTDDFLPPEDSHAGDDDIPI